MQEVLAQSWPHVGLRPLLHRHQLWNHISDVPGNECRVIDRDGHIVGIASCRKAKHIVSPGLVAAEAYAGHASKLGGLQMTCSKTPPRLQLDLNAPIQFGS